jgi:hypothetical protein
MVTVLAVVLCLLSLVACCSAQAFCDGNVVSDYSECSMCKNFFMENGPLSSSKACIECSDPNITTGRFSCPQGAYTLEQNLDNCGVCDVGGLLYMADYSTPCSWFPNKSWTKFRTGKISILNMHYFQIGCYCLIRHLIFVQSINVSRQRLC